MLVYWNKRKFNSHRTGLKYQHGRRFYVLTHQHGRREVMLKTLCRQTGSKVFQQSSPKVQFHLHKTFPKCNSTQHQPSLFRKVKMVITALYAENLVSSCVYSKFILGCAKQKTWVVRNNLLFHPPFFANCWQVVILEHKSIICAGYRAVLHIHNVIEEVVFEVRRYFLWLYFMKIFSVTFL